MQNVPIYLSLAFVVITLACVYIFYRATNKSQSSVIVLLGWLALQTGASLTGFYTFTSSMPPRMVLLLIPPLILIIILFNTKAGKKFINDLDLAGLTLLHAVRIPVELVLLGLFLAGAVPELMTFEGRNFDILSGLSALVVYYILFVWHRFHKGALLVWNFICLGLLINIVSNAILAIPSPIQQQAFDQPNIAVLYFPFVWLPCCVVPLVLFAHLVAIRRLIYGSFVISE